MNNTEIADNGTEVYTNRLFVLADEYIQEKHGGEEDNVTKQFRDLIFYITDRIEKPDNDDIEALDRLFNAYVRLCTNMVSSLRWNVLAGSLELTGIHSQIGLRKGIGLTPQNMVALLKSG